MNKKIRAFMYLFIYSFKYSIKMYAILKYQVEENIQFKACSLSYLC